MATVPSSPDPNQHEEPEATGEDESSPPVSIGISLLKRLLRILDICTELDYSRVENRDTFQTVFTRDEWDCIYRDFVAAEGLVYQATRLDQFIADHVDFIFALPAEGTEERGSRLAHQCSMIEASGLATEAQLKFVIGLYAATHSDSDNDQLNEGPSAQV